MNRPIRILQVISHLSGGGAEKQCRYIVENLDSQRYHTGVVYLHKSPDDQWPNHVEKIHIDRGNLLSVYTLWKEISEVTRAFSPDIIHVWLPELITVPAAFYGHQNNIPVISSHRRTMRYHGMLAITLRDQLSYLQHGLADRLVSNFDVSAEPLLFQWLYNQKQGRAIANGIDNISLRDLKYQKLPENGRQHFIFAGRIAKEKGIHIAIKALAMLSRQGQDVDITLFGKGSESYTDQLRQQASVLGIEHLLTFISNTPDWQAYASDAVAILMPSYAEGTSNVALEALSVGVPLVIANIEMSRELLRNNHNAIIVPNYDPDTWAESMLGLIKDVNLRASLAKNGVQVADQFDISKMTSEYRMLYEEVLQ